MGGPGGRPVTDGAAGITWAATLDDDGQPAASTETAARSRGDHRPPRPDEHDITSSTRTTDSGSTPPTRTHDGVDMPKLLAREPSRSSPDPASLLPCGGQDSSGRGARSSRLHPSGLPDSSHARPRAAAHRPLGDPGRPAPACARCPQLTWCSEETPLPSGCHHSQRMTVASQRFVACAAHPNSLKRTSTCAKPAERNRASSVAGSIGLYGSPRAVPTAQRWRRCRTPRSMRPTTARERPREQAVLQGCRRNVVEHREGHCSREPTVGERQPRCISVDDLDVRATQPLGEGPRQLLVELPAVRRSRVFAEEVGRHPRPGPTLQHVMSEPASPSAYGMMRSRSTLRPPSLAHSACALRSRPNLGRSSAPGRGVSRRARARPAPPRAVTPPRHRARSAKVQAARNEQRSRPTRGTTLPPLLRRDTPPEAGASVRSRRMSLRSHARARPSASAPEFPPGCPVVAQLSMAGPPAPGRSGRSGWAR
jgi:hypothetical protein